MYATTTIGTDETAALLYLSRRNEAAEEIISTTARSHATIDAISGTIGSIVPIPGAGVVVLAGQLLHQMTHIYPDMIEQLAYVYRAEPDRITKRKMSGATVREAIGDGLGLEVVNHLKHEFGQQFFSDIGTDLAVENAPGLLASSIPVVGALFSGGLDALIAATLTWRVGTMVSIYFQNGDFIRGHRKSTYDLVKKQLVKRSPATSRPGTLAKVRDIPEVRQNMVAKVRVIAKAMLQANPDRALVKKILVDTGPDGSTGFPPDVVDEALAGI